VLYPSFAYWHTDDLQLAIFATFGGLALLIPVIWLGFLVLSRKSAKSFTAVYLACNALLLVPVRDPVTVSVIALAMAVFVLFYIGKATQKDTALKTPEGMIARGLLLLPLAVILGRNLWLYAADAFMFTMMGVIAFITLRQLSMQLSMTSKIRRFLEQSSVAIAGAIGMGLNILLEETLHVDALLLPAVALTVAGLIIEISTRASAGGAAYRRLAAVIASASMIANLLLFGSVATAAACLGIGLLLIVYGHMVEQRLVFGVGLITLGFGLVYQVSLAISMFDLGSWSSLASLGIGAILVSSAIERHGAKLKIKMTDWGRRIKAWEN
jgi:hypothetical protein